MFLSCTAFLAPVSIKCVGGTEKHRAFRVSLYGIPLRTHCSACRPFGGWPGTTGTSLVHVGKNESLLCGIEAVASQAFPDDTADCSVREDSTDSTPQYVPLHVHSDFSLLDGASRLSDLVARAVELGVPALALTDHGVLYGAISLVKLCNASSVPVKPIIGNEMYIVNIDTPYIPLEKVTDISSTNPAKLLTSTPSAPGILAIPSDSNTTKSSFKRSARQKHPRRYHLIVLAKNTVGYRNLVQLTTYAHLYGKVGSGIFARPSVNKAMLHQHRRGLIVSSGCLGGEIAQAILVNRPDIARDIALWFKDVFEDNFYLEMQDHGSDEDKKVNREIVKIGNDLKIPVIITNDSHFTSCLDAEAHDALVCIQTGKVITDENRLRYAGNEYFKSVDEMRACFQDHVSMTDIANALANTLGVAEKVEPYDLFGETRIPDFPVPASWCANVDDSSMSTTELPSSDHSRYLSAIARQGLDERLLARQSSGLIPSHPGIESIRQEYFERLDFELRMIQRMGFASYFLVVWDYVRFARSEGIPVGPGRGSAAGSLVAFALRITDIDPIQYNLLFERFLNPERKSMPDIDTDFSVEGREKVIQYVTRKYGEDHVAQIITFNRLTSKAVLKDVARVHQVPYSEADKLAKLIPVARGKPASLDQMLSKDSPSKEFKTLVTSRPGYSSWIEKARRIEGTNKTYGIHAAGVVISAHPLTDAVPLSKAKHGETITQYPMEDVEALGLLKMDFLGLKNLTVIETTLAFINSKRRRLRGKGVGNTAHADRPLLAPRIENDSVPSVDARDVDLDFSVDALPLDDSVTFEFLTTGELDGIFQLDASAGMRKIVRELRPSSLDDISSILALYRPGPLDAGLVPKFIRRKHGHEPIEYDHPLLEPILKETYGIMVYQEQIMRIARDLAGYTLGQADILRRAMGKKKTSEMEKEKPRFVAGAMKQGVPEAVATTLFETMIMFAEYCFNKSHSTAYAYLTYQTAFLKANFPVEFSAALLRANSQQTDKLVRYLADANVSGVRVLPPSINRSEISFSVDTIAGNHGMREQSVVLFGLEAIKTVGESVGGAVIHERNVRGEYRSIIEFIERLDSKGLNKRSLRALVMCGAFDELHSNRKVLCENIEVLLQLHRKIRDRRKRLAKKVMTEDEKQAAIAKEASEWENVQLQLNADCENCQDYDMMEKLSGEKEFLGFYASGHPLHDLDEVGRVLGSTSILNVIGTDSGEEDTTDRTLGDGYSTVLPSVASGDVKDGGEVMCLSLVTDLKRMVTSKGRNMAKWTMEDAMARVTAILFPNAYPICEAVLESSNNGDRSGSVDEEFVVRNDARVVVWGTVDRESSGTAQVIVDDVQRVEDVRVVVVTSRFDASSSVSAEEKVGLLHGIAKAVEDPSAPFIHEADEYVYRGKDGEEVRGRRRGKKADLKTKARIPVVLKQLDADGQAMSYTYAGHGCRLSDVSDQKLATLAKRTSCHVEVLSLCDLIMSPSSVKRESAAGCMDGNKKTISRVASTSVVSKDSVRNSADVDSAAKVSRSSRPTLLPSELGGHDIGALTKSENTSRNEYSQPPVSTQVEQRQKEGEKPCSGTEGQIRLHKEISEKENSDLQSRMTDSAAGCPDFDDLQTLEGAKVAPLFSASSLKAPRTSRLLQKLRARSVPVAEKVSNDFPRQSARASVQEDTSVTLAKQISSVSLQHVLPHELSVHTSRSLAVHDHCMPSRFSRDNSFAQANNEDGIEPKEIICSGSSRNVERLNAHEETAGAMSEVTILHNSSSIAKHGNLMSPISDSVDSHVVPTTVSDPILEDICSDDISLDGERSSRDESDHVEESHTRQSRQDEGSTIGLANSQSTTLSQSSSNKPKLSPCSVQVDLQGVGLSKLLDAVGFVAGESAWTFAGTALRIKSVDQIVLPPDVGESDSFNVSSKVALTNKNKIHSMVRIRECRPTGNRKRIRMLGSVVVMFEAFGDEPPAYVPKSLLAKKESALVRERLSNVEDPVKTDLSSGALLELSWPFCYDSSNPAETLYDGGYVMACLCLAAEHAACELSGAEQSARAVSMTSFHSYLECFETEHLLGLTVQARVICVASETSKVQVLLLNKYSSVQDLRQKEICAQASFTVAAFQASS